jgi:hypothetical protein
VEGWRETGHDPQVLTVALDCLACGEGVVGVMTDSDGQECDLPTMCMREPGWAANRIAALTERVRDLESQFEALTDAREFACECPPPGCDCPGCSYARAESEAFSKEQP